MLKRFLVGLTLVLLVGGCSQNTVATPKVPSNIEDREWELVSFGVTKTLVPKNVTLLLIDGRYLGNAGCNDIGGEYAIYEEKITFKAGISTMMSCPDIDSEMRFLELMQKVDHYRIEGNSLILLHEGKSVLNFVEK